MTAKKCDIEELLTGCSPIVQRIVNAGNKFSIPSEEEGDEESSGIEEVTNFVFQDMDYVLKRINQPKPTVLSLPQQLSPSSTNTVQDYIRSQVLKKF